MDASPGERQVRHPHPTGHLDAASGLPLSPAGERAWQAALDAGWADPRRLHRDARRAALLLEAARESVASVVGCSPPEVSFDHSLESAARRALLGTALGRRRVSDLVVASSVEHSAILHAAATHERTGGRTLLVDVDHRGRVDPEGFATAARGAAVAALQAANHEVGTLQPVEEVADRLPDVPMVLDAHQVLGRADVPRGWSVLVAAARQWGGPPGVAVLAVRPHVRWRALEDPSDGREGGRVPGVPDVPAIVAAAAALEDAQARRRDQQGRLRGLVERIRAEVPRRVPDVEVLGDPNGCLPHLVTFSCLYVDGEALLGELEREGFVVSSGSACTADALEPSHVLVAMGVLTQGNVRVSLAPWTDEATIDRFLDVLPDVVARVRAQLGASDL